MEVDSGDGYSNLRPDLVLGSEAQQILYILEQTVPWGDAVKMAHE